MGIPRIYITTWVQVKEFWDCLLVTYDNRNHHTGHLRSCPISRVRKVKSLSHPETDGISKNQYRSLLSTDFTDRTDFSLVFGGYGGVGVFHLQKKSFVKPS
jgi:hypothetical protein